MDYNLSKSRFLNSIDKYAKKKCLKLTEEIRQIENDRLIKEENKIIEQAKLLMMSELAGVKSKISLEIYKEQTDAMQKICKKFSDIEKEVFELCIERLKKFTESDSYQNKLRCSLEYALKFFDIPFDVFAREKDIPRLKEFKDLISQKNVFVDNKIKNGGLIFKKGNVILDDSYDYHLKEQHKSFAEKFICRLT